MPYFKVSVKLVLTGSITVFASDENIGIEMVSEMNTTEVLNRAMMYGNLEITDIEDHTLHCPHCGEPITESPDKTNWIECPSCGYGITIAVEGGK